MPKLKIWAALAFAASLSAPSIAAKSDYSGWIGALSKVVAENFYDPHLRGVDWQALTRTYQIRARGVSSDAEFRKLAAEMMSSLGTSHTDVLPPSRGGPGAAPAAYATPAIRFVAKSGEGLVTEVAALSDARAKGLQPGFSVRNMAELGGELGSEARLAVRDCAGLDRRIAARRESAFWPPAQPAFRWLRMRTSPTTTYGYLRVDAFDDKGAELADQAMADLGNTQGLIIDLRSNGGGNASAARLASYFVAEAGPAVILLDRSYIQALGRTPTKADALAARKVERTYTTAKVWEALRANRGGIAIWTEDMGAKLYKKPVAVLIGPDTGSAAEGFAWIMKLRSPATLVGERTAGALLSAQTLEFGDGWSVRVPMAGVWGPDGTDYGDKAVIPHLQVSPERETLCAGRDKQLEAALQVISRS
jgi:carboxyl-terminal processing protease